MAQTQFAPREVFEEILEYMPIPTFDVIVQYGDNGVVVVKRIIEPYKNVWAFPGLRMYKGESIEDTISRVLKQELGIEPDISQREFVGQFVGKFRTEHNRQDISTCYAIRVPEDVPLRMNPEHFSQLKIVKDIPKPIGKMYEYYLSCYFAL